MQNCNFLNQLVATPESYVYKHYIIDYKVVWFRKYKKEQFYIIVKEVWANIFGLRTFLELSTIFSTFIDDEEHSNKAKKYQKRIFFNNNSTINKNINTTKKIPALYFKTRMEKLKFPLVIDDNFTDLRFSKYNFKFIEINLLQQKSLFYQFFFVSANGFNSETLINETFNFSAIFNNLILEDDFDSKSIFFDYDFFNNEDKVFNLLKVFDLDVQLNKIILGRKVYSNNYIRNDELALEYNEFLTDNSTVYYYNNEFSSGNNFSLIRKI